MFLIINIAVILLIFRLLFSNGVLRKLMDYHWKLLLRFQHVFFLLLLILITFFTENYFLDSFFLVWGIILNMLLNIGIYYLVYFYLVPYYYLSNKYPEFILYALICFLVSSLFRILWEPAIFSINFNKEGLHAVFLYNIYLVQGIVILVASFLGITKDKFLTEQDVIDLGEEKDQIYLELLKSKLNPHFLLNTLNNMYANSFTSSEKTSDSILQLSKLLQYIIYDTAKQKISIAHEFASIKSLLGLYQLKYNNQLDVTFTIENEETWDLIEIPPSVFLTLFENALKHSAVGLEQESFIRVSYKFNNRQIFFEIFNSVKKNKNITSEIGYQGLGNEAVIHILEKYYSGKYLFSSEPIDMENYRTILKIDLNE